MKKYVFSIFADEGSSIEIIKAKDIESAIDLLKKDFIEFDVHAIYSEEI